MGRRTSFSVIQLHRGRLVLAVIGIALQVGPAQPGLGGRRPLPSVPLAPGLPARGPQGIRHPYFPNRPTFRERLRDVVLQACDSEDRDTAVLRRRAREGIDRFPRDFPDIAPEILGASDSPEGKLRVIAEKSRTINWIRTIADAGGLSTPISVFLSAELARAKRLRCPFRPVRCEPDSSYRSVDGQCNNLDHPLWGAANTPYTRQLPADYDWGYADSSRRLQLRDSPRQSGRGGQSLPNARLVSNVVHGSFPTPPQTPEETTALYTDFGLALTFDIAETPKEKGFRGAVLDCCDETYATRRCASIKIPDNDFFRQFRRSCLPFQRSTEVTDVECSQGIRQQLNTATSFVDGTQLYGRSIDDLDAIRDENGLLKVSFPNHLPYQQHPNAKASAMGVNIVRTGIQSASFTTGSVGILTVWYREHNRIATQLATFDTFSQLPENVRGHLIFEETRKIVVAEMQHVTYNEYLPITVGPVAADKYNINSQQSDFFKGYNPDVDPSLTNEFAAAYFRFGHSMVRNSYSILDKNYQPTGKTLRLRKIFWRPNFYLLFENGFQRGVLTDISEVCDRYVSEDLRNHLFETQRGDGLDLAAINIQRGRDHGLQPYAKYRELAFLSVPSEWSTDRTYGFTDIDPDTVQKFRSVYGDPADVDLWSAGISEIPVAGGQVGPLFSKLIAQQFADLKIGDRFWYEREQTGFTLARLNEIRNVTMARIMCNNLEDLDYIQPSAFLAPTRGGTNDRVPCSSLPDVNLDLWQ